MEIKILNHFLLLIQQGQQPGIIGMLLPWILIFGIFYFLIIRPQQRQRKKHEEALRNLKRGDRVVTSGGIIAEVVHIKETSKDGTPQRAMDDEVTIKSAETRLVVERGRIAKIVDVGSSAPSPATPASTS
jgi:preprotein translocase subunit YajC